MKLKLTISQLYKLQNSSLTIHHSPLDLRPFGLKIPGMTRIEGAENKYTYNGKEPYLIVNDELLMVNSSKFIIYNSQFTICAATDPADEFHSPYVYCANNPVMLVDPDGCRTEITTDENNVVTDMNVNFALINDPNVYINRNLIGSEPPLDSYFYQYNPKTKNYFIEDKEYKFIGDFSSDLLTDVKSAWKFPIFPNELKWKSKGEYDFIYDHQYQIGLAFNTVMTSRDAGNANWGAYCKDRYNFGLQTLERLSNYVAGGKEDSRSLSMQKWGYKLNPYYISNLRK